MAPTHSGATAPVRAQGPARYSVLDQGLRIMRVGLRLKGVIWDGAPSRGSGVLTPGRSWTP